MKINSFSRNYFLYIRITAKPVPGFPVILPLHALLQCMDALYDSYTFFALFIPSLRKNANGNASCFLKEFYLIEQLLTESSRSEVKDLVSVNVAKENVSVNIRLL